MIPVIIGAVVGGVGGGIYAGTTSYEKQKEENNGDVNGWIVTRDAFLGSVAGSTIMGLSTFAAAGTITAFGPTSATALVVGGATAAVNTGLTYRSSKEFVTSITANVLKEAEAETYVFTEPKVPQQMFNDALEAAADPSAMMLDAAVGSIAGLSTYGISQMMKYQNYAKCGDISKNAKMNVADDAMDKIDDVANMVDDLANSTRSIPNAEQLKMSQTVKNHMNDIIKKGPNAGEISRPYIDSDGTTLLLKEIMESKTPVKDVVLQSGLRWNVTGTFRGSSGTCELVVDTSTNTVVHFNFVAQ